MLTLNVALSQYMKTIAVTYTKPASIWQPDQLAGYLTQTENRFRDFHENVLL